MNANALKRVVTPLANLMSAKGVSVSFHGTDAKTEYDKDGNPKKIHLPLLSDEAGEEVIGVFHGYFDHEIAHVLYSDFSDKEVLKEVAGNEMLKQIFNIVEDARIERKLCENFRGCAYNLGKLHSYVFGKEYIDNFSPADTVAGVVNRLIFATRKMADISYFCTVKNDDVNALINILSENFGPDCVRDLKNCRDAVNLSKDIMKYFELEDVELDPKDTSKDGESGSDSESSDSKGEPGDGDFDGSKGKETKEADGASSKNCKQSEVDRKMLERLAELARQARSNQEYVIDTTDHDKIEVCPVVKDDSQLKYFDMISSGTLGTIQKNLERVMASESIVSWASGQRKGKIQNSALSRVLVKDDRVFKRRIVNSRSKDVAVSLVIDCSGSMDGSKIMLAVVSAYALSHVLSNIGISHEIIGFTTLGFSSKRSYDDEEYARVLPLYIPIFKSFNESYTVNTKRRLAHAISEMKLCNNVDGESIQIAADRLMSRPESRKVMIVLSDGYPAADGNNLILSSHLEETLRSLERKKVEIVGIGIMSDSVKSYYSKNVVLNNIEDLPTTVIKELKSFLIPKK